MDRFEFKFFVVKNVAPGGLHLPANHWFDGETDLGRKLTPEVLAPYGWEVAATIASIGGTQAIILQRRCSPA